MNKVINSFVQFLKEVKVELSKIVWPGFNEFIGSSIVVFIIIVFFSLYLGFVDKLFAELAKYIFVM